MDPDEVTRLTKSSPTRIFRVGEARGRAASKVNGWEFRTAWFSDPNYALRAAVGPLTGDASIFGAHVESGAVASLTCVGYVFGDVVDEPSKADELGYLRPEPFESFLASPTLELILDAACVSFLDTAKAYFRTHIDVALSSEAQGLLEEPYPERR